MDNNLSPGICQLNWGNSVHHLDKGSLQDVGLVAIALLPRTRLQTESLKISRMETEGGVISQDLYASVPMQNRQSSLLSG